MSEPTNQRGFHPVRRHPDHPKCLLFRNQPIKLVTATEHYGAVLNRPFRFEIYLRDCGARGINYTRLFALFREQQSAMNPQSTCKPASPDFLTPFARTGPDGSCDGQPAYDLDKPNPEYFDRLHRFLSLAGENGVIVELTVLSNTYDPGVWALNPLCSYNNLNKVENAEWPDYQSRRHPKLFRYQSSHVRRIVEETRQYDNVIYEICNEPGGGVGPQYPSPAEVNDWQRAIAKVIREADTDQNGPHMISGQEAFAYHLEDESRRAGSDVFQFSDESFDSMPFDLVNMHPLSNMISRDRTYNVGPFMRGEMCLHALKKYCLDLYAEGKPLCLDEDNCATQYRDNFGWKIHRKRAWITLFCGAHYDCIDFTINNFLETGYSDSDPQGIRKTIGHLARFINAGDLPFAEPMQGLVQRLPADCIEATLAAEDGRYFIYIADAREIPRGQSASPIRGTIALRLKPGAYQVSSFSPVSGLYSPWIGLRSASEMSFELPEFSDDIVLCVRTATGVS